MVPYHTLGFFPKENLYQVLGNRGQTPVFPTPPSSFSPPHSSSTGKYPSTWWLSLAGKSPKRRLSGYLEVANLTHDLPPRMLSTQHPQLVIDNITKNFSPEALLPPSHTVSLFWLGTSNLPYSPRQSPPRFGWCLLGRGFSSDSRLRRTKRPQETPQSGVQIKL